MSRQAVSSRFARRMGVAGASVVLGLAAVSPAVAQSRDVLAPANRAPTINTYRDWTGDSVGTFGRPGVATFGQVITVETTVATDLVRFQFYATQIEHEGHLILRGEIYEWNCCQATGNNLWESKPRRIALQEGDPYRPIVFHVGGIQLTPGTRYVLFVSVSKDFHDCTDGYKLRWASVPDSSYEDGTFVYLRNRSREDQWTTSQWTRWYGDDLAFKAWLRPHVVP